MRKALKQRILVTKDDKALKTPVYRDSQSNPANTAQLIVGLQQGRVAK